jgi:hypothetical protein
MSKEKTWHPLGLPGRLSATDRNYLLPALRIPLLYWNLEEPIFCVRLSPLVVGETAPHRLQGFLVIEFQKDDIS